MFCCGQHLVGGGSQLEPCSAQFQSHLQGSLGAQVAHPGRCFIIFLVDSMYINMRSFIEF
jgi:hypothetical protein